MGPTKARATGGLDWSHDADGRIASGLVFNSIARKVNAVRWWWGEADNNGRHGTSCGRARHHRLPYGHRSVGA
jgi:hypothetical protein